MTSLAIQLENLPIRPGVYLFKDAAGNVLYVGKAKVLRNRVRSYFSSFFAQASEDKPSRAVPSPRLDPAKQQMVPQVATVETISCDSEHEALVLEANLIHQHRPPYNVVLMDDKYYLFIKITKEEWPRVLLVRRFVRDGARYFGPFASAQAVRQTLKLLQRLFPFRGEKDAARETIFPHPLFTANSKRRSRVEPAADLAVYQENIHNIIRFLRGEREEIMKTLRQGMVEAAQAKHFERAALWRDQLQAIERLQSRQKVYLPRPESFDVISIASKAGQSAANVFAVRGGKLLQKNTFLLRHRSVAPATDVLRQFLLQYYAVAQDIPPAIFVPHLLPDEASIARWMQPQRPPRLAVPRRGVKRNLQHMGDHNAEALLHVEQQQLASKARLKRAVDELFAAIDISPAKTAGSRIETYDISNIQGSLATGSMVVFVDGQAQPKHYKKFRIRTLTTPNDFAMLQEILERRFSNRHQDWPMPDLLVIDGGKGQLSAVQAVLRATGVTVPVVAMAKEEEKIFIPGRAAPLQLPYDSDALFLMQRMRDEAHRFTISYHRLLRSRQQQHSVLDTIPGIGPAAKKKLLNHFGSLKGIRAASPDELATVIGRAKAGQLYDYL